MSSFKIHSWTDKEELHMLRDLPDPPKQLFARGNWDPSLFSQCVAIVGSRRMTSYGRQVIEQIIPPLVLAGKTIVSGFMYGVDQYAHRVCIDNGGKTIAVLGWGIDIPLEDEDRKLADSILSHGGLLLSEWDTQKATLWTFPLRNRIVAALCTDVIVVEAALKSGSLITAKLANKLHRKLFAVPGPITSKTSAGTNMLIASGQAQMWTGERKEEKKKHTTDPLLSLIENEALSANEIARKLGKPVAEVGAQLTLFAITGEITERDGKYSVE